MATYTDVADANGDFIVPFSSAYTGGQKITVTAEKNGAEKSIDLFAPSEVVGGGNIRFTGNVNNFPVNIGGVELHGFTGTVSGFNVTMFSANATSLYIREGVTTVAASCFRDWLKMKTLHTPESLKTIGASSFAGLRALENVEDINRILRNMTQTVTPNLVFFQADKAAGHLVIPDHITEVATQSFSALQKVTKLTLGKLLSKINIQSFSNFYSCDEIICKRVTPPTIDSGSFDNLKPTCIFKVPAESVGVYQAATNWSTYAARIQAI